ncbi:MAG: alpha/beta fold hydrolase [Planctomycetota bacterium]|nr:MAG: alpha/beta fold hydrolase [Planctomycetota bacterium]
MNDRLAAFPRSLRERTRLLRLGPAPALLVLPAGEGPFPLFVWLHGRTANKELDSARYLRLLRAGIATLALDLPGHGEREDFALQAPSALPDLLQAALAELDPALEALRAEPEAPRIAWERLALGGMSAGGMITLRRLCDPHPFRCAAVESTAGDFVAAAGGRARDRMLVARMRGLDPSEHLEGWEPLPLLALHSARDEIAPLAGIEAFFARLREHYRARGADPGLLRLHVFPETGAPREHAGFGRQAAKARALLLEFLGEHL